MMSVQRFARGNHVVPTAGKWKGVVCRVESVVGNSVTCLNLDAVLPMEQMVFLDSMLDHYAPKLTVPNRTLPITGTAKTLDGRVDMLEQVVAKLTTPAEDIALAEQAVMDGPTASLNSLPLCPVCGSRLVSAMPGQAYCNTCATRAQAEAAYLLPPITDCGNEHVKRVDPVHEALKDVVVETTLDVEQVLRIGNDDALRQAVDLQKAAIEALRLFRTPKAEEPMHTHGADVFSRDHANGGFLVACKCGARGRSTVMPDRNNVTWIEPAKAEEVPAPRCEPEGGSIKAAGYHWLERSGGIQVPAFWDLQKWQCHGHTERYTAEEIYTNGWRYHSPAKPLPTEQEPSEDKLRAWVNEWQTRHHLDRWTYLELITAALRAFKPFAAEVEVSDEAIKTIARDWAIQISDGHYKFSENFLLAFTHAALTKFSTPKAEKLSRADIDCIWRAHFGEALQDRAADILDYTRSIESRARGET